MYAKHVCYIGCVEAGEAGWERELLEEDGADYNTIIQQFAATCLGLVFMRVTQQSNLGLFSTWLPPQSTLMIASNHMLGLVGASQHYSLIVQYHRRSLSARHSLHPPALIILEQLLTAKSTTIISDLSVYTQQIIRLICSVWRKWIVRWQYGKATRRKIGVTCWSVSCCD